MITRATIGSGVTPLISGSVLNVFVVCGTPVSHWPEMPGFLNVEVAVQPTILSSANAQPVPHGKNKYGWGAPGPTVNPSKFVSTVGNMSK